MIKKLLIFTTFSFIGFISWCNKVGQQITITKPLEQEIFKLGNYSLDCKSKYYTSSIISAISTEESYITTSEGTERDTLYIDWENAKFFGADYNVLQDDNNFLIIMRHYKLSGLTETVSINKKSWIWFDIKTNSIWITWAPTSTTYVLSCTEL